MRISISLFLGAHPYFYHFAEKRLIDKQVPSQRARLIHLLHESLPVRSNWSATSEGDRDKPLEAWRQSKSLSLSPIFFQPQKTKESQRFANDKLQQARQVTLTYRNTPKLRTSDQNSRPNPPLAKRKKAGEITR